MSWIFSVQNAADVMKEQDASDALLKSMTTKKIYLDTKVWIERTGTEIE